MKEIITESEFRKRIAKKPIGGYLFFGDEDYLKHHAMKSAREAVCPDPSLAVFNDLRIDMSAASLSPDELYSRIASALSAAPMMADYKAVTIDGLFADELRPAELDAVCRGAELAEEFDFNLFIISVPAGMLDPGRLPKSPSSTLSKLAGNLTAVNFEYVGEAKLAAWAVRHFEHHGVKPYEGVTAALIGRCGKNMFTLAGEIEKLCFYALENGRNTVSAEDVSLVTCLEEVFDPYALGSAVADGNSRLALRILAVEKAQRTEPVIILAELSKTLSDMLSIKLLSSAGMPPREIAGALRMKSDYRVKLYLGKVRDLPQEKLRRAVALCAEADGALKNSSSGYGEIERLICAL